MKLVKLILRLTFGAMVLLAAFPALAEGRVDSSLPVSATSAVGTSESPRTIISPAQAVVLGLVEGITEYLPVSSTGHLVLVDELLGLRDATKLSTSELDAVEAYEVVIQSGAILAVILLYFKAIQQMLLGVVGRSEEGRRLLVNVVCAFAVTGVIGVFAHKLIKQYLQHSGPVIFALAAGGLLMLAFESSRWAKAARDHGYGLNQLTPRHAAMIGLAQCLAMWPGTSRSMMTILSGMFLGMNPVAAAEFSFILGLPTLLAATGLKLYKEGPLLTSHIGLPAMGLGLGVAAVAAAIAVRGFTAYLARRGFVPFGIYRIALAVVMFLVLGLGAEA